MHEVDCFFKYLQIRHSTCIALFPHRAQLDSLEQLIDDTKLDKLGHVLTH